MKAPDRLPSWLGYVGLSFVWLVILAVVVFLGRRPATKPIEIVPPPTPEPTLAASPTPVQPPIATPGLLHVDVAGAVRHPAVYRLAQGSLIADAIAAAGGPADDADLDQINKAIPLENNVQVYVPHRVAAGACSGEAEAATPPPVSTAPVPPARSTAVSEATALPASIRVNLNTASLAELDTLPGVGEATAQKIVAGRPYTRIEDLLRVDGIGETKLARLRDLVTVE